MHENKRKFDHRIENPDPQVVAMLAAIDETRGVFRVGLRMTPQAIIGLRKSVLITSAGASTRIEGSKLSDEDVKKIMQGLSMQKFADRDSQEVQGYLETLKNVFENHKDLPLREGVIMSLHKELLKYSNKDDLHRGQYKHKENVVGVLNSEGNVAQIMFETTPAHFTSKEMTELVDWTREALEKERFHPLLIIANFIVEFLKIHPFEDGNGRLSRVLTNLLLLQSGYPFVEYISHEQIVEQRKDQYYFALRSSQITFKTNRETISPWLNFFLSVVKAQATKSLVLIEEDNHADTLSSKQNEVLEYLSNVNEAAPAEIAMRTGILLPTVRKALLQLVKRGLVKRMGRGRATRYKKV
ncbi:MAG: Fic family protein [bacterium]|nr:Fic family protein [bacterium]